MPGRTCFTRNQIRLLLSSANSSSTALGEIHARTHLLHQEPNQTLVIIRQLFQHGPWRDPCPDALASPGTKSDSCYHPPTLPARPLERSMPGRTCFTRNQIRLLLSSANSSSTALGEIHARTHLLHQEPNQTLVIIRQLFRQLANRSKLLLLLFDVGRFDRKLIQRAQLLLVVLLRVGLRTQPPLAPVLADIQR